MNLTFGLKNALSSSFVNRPKNCVQVVMPRFFSPSYPAEEGNYTALTRALFQDGYHGVKMPPVSFYDLVMPTTLKIILKVHQR